MSVTIIGNECRNEHNISCIHNGTVVCRECRNLAGNTKLNNLFESGESRRKHVR